MTTTTVLRTITGQDLGTQLHSKRLGLTLCASKMEPVTNDRFHKPQGGLWTSTANDETVSGWYEWGKNEGMIAPNAVTWTLIPEPNALLVEIDSYGDLTALVAQYGGSGSYGQLVIDFEAMARDGYDGMHLTDRGQWATRMSKPNLYGWDCESTVWFRWAFSSVVGTTAEVVNAA